MVVVQQVNAASVAPEELCQVWEYHQGYLGLGLDIFGCPRYNWTPVFQTGGTEFGRCGLWPGKQGIMESDPHVWQQVGRSRPKLLEFCPSHFNFVPCKSPTFMKVHYWNTGVIFKHTLPSAAIGDRWSYLRPTLFQPETGSSWKPSYLLWIQANNSCHLPQCSKI